MAPMTPLRFLAALALALATTTSAAQPTAADAAAPQSMQQLAERAKQEGELLVYTSAPVEDIRALADAFEARYGVRVKVWRAGSEKVLQRTLAEARAGRHEVDVVETNGTELEAMVREKALQPVASPAHAELIAQALPAHRGWVGTRLNVFVSAYNTSLVSRDELPKRWEDLKDPRWKGRLGIEAEDADWFATVVAGLGGEAVGVALFRDIVRGNGISVRKGHTLLTQLVASGEVPLALTVYNYKAEQLKEKGAPIDWFVIGTPIARPNGIGVAAKPRHPHAARLFYEFAIGEEGQRIYRSRDFVPVHRRVDAGLDRDALRFVDVARVLDESAKWERLYQSTFLRPR